MLSVSEGSENKKTIPASQPCPSQNSIFNALLQAHKRNNSIKILKITKKTYL